MYISNENTAKLFLMRNNFHVERADLQIKYDNFGQHKNSQNGHRITDEI